jgi:hypothetical protein
LKPDRASPTPTHQAVVVESPGTDGRAVPVRGLKSNSSWRNNPAVLNRYTR